MTLFSLCDKIDFMAGKTHTNLEEYRSKRNFSRSPEPSGEKEEVPEDIFVVQLHSSSHLHYDFRLRLHGSLKSWAVPKGPSLDPDEERLANQTEDHPLEYADFEGIIPPGEYGAGTVMIWDQGWWEPLDEGKQGYYQGRLHFVLHGKRLRGAWTLTRETAESPKWLLTKEKDEFATPAAAFDETSVATGRTMEEIAADTGVLWTATKGLVMKRAEVGFGHGPGGRLPDFIPPLASTLVTDVPEGQEWLHEIKYDGYRMVCRIDREGSGVRFFTRKGIDFTDRLGILKEAVARVPVTRAWMDGEIVVLTPDGRSDFHALQNVFFGGGTRREITYLIFDLMNYEGYDIRSAPLVERKAILADLIPESEHIRYLEHVTGNGREFYEAACRMQLEGIVSKRSDSEYSPAGKNWLKVKCSRRQEFVVGGYTESGVGRVFGSLLAGYYDDRGNLLFAGKIKSGYSDAGSRALIEILRRHEQQEPAFINPPSGHEYRNPHWLKPELVAEVEYTELTDTGFLRHASYKGLRDDKDPREVRLETPQPIAEAVVTEPQPSPKPKKQPVFPHERITREQVAEYYSFVSERILPHMIDRPLTLIVCPGNIYACKFTKHATNIPAPVRAIEAGHEEKYIAVDDREGMKTLLEIGAVEFHGWQSRYARLEFPDRLVFDLDPPEEEDFQWERLAEGALLLRNDLLDKGLESFIMTTGGKGYYVMVPLLPEMTWRVTTQFAKRVSEEMEEKYADRFTSKMDKSRRRGKIYVDWMRNGRGANSAEPYCLRARPGAPVATPITWEELVRGVRPDAFNLLNIRERLEKVKTDPWEEYFKVQQRLPDR